jgi:hypothetical protein
MKINSNIIKQIYSTADSTLHEQNCNAAIVASQHIHNLNPCIVSQIFWHFLNKEYVPGRRQSIVNKGSRHVVILNLV